GTRRRAEPLGDGRADRGLSRGHAPGPPPAPQPVGGRRSRELRAARHRTHLRTRRRGLTVTRWHHPKELDDLNEVGGHCPRCRAEYRPGFTMCADCNVPLVPGPAPSPDEAPADVPRDWWDQPVQEEPPEDRVTEPAKIATFGSSEEAWLLAGRLRTDGIPATVFPPDVSPY